MFKNLLKPSKKKFKNQSGLQKTVTMINASVKAAKATGRAMQTAHSSTTGKVVNKRRQARDHRNQGRQDRHRVRVGHDEEVRRAKAEGRFEVTYDAAGRRTGYRIHTVKVAAHARTLADGTVIKVKSHQRTVG